MKPALLKDYRRKKSVARPSEFDIAGLMLAVLEDALGIYKDGLLSPTPAKRAEAFKVEVWASSDDVEWPFSFVNVCNAVGVSPEYVRTCMTRWRRNAVRNDEWEN